MWKATNLLGEPLSRMTRQALRVGHQSDIDYFPECASGRVHQETRINTGVDLAAPQGFEPRYADPESAVLPLNEGAATKRKMLRPFDFRGAVDVGQLDHPKKQSLPRIQPKWRKPAQKSGQLRRRPRQTKMSGCSLVSSFSTPYWFQVCAANSQTEKLASA